MSKKPTIIAPQPPRLDVRADLLKIAATCMARNDIRYYLNGVYIEPREGGGVIIVATDGHRICAVIDASGAISAPTILTLDHKLERAIPSPRFSDGVDQKDPRKTYWGKEAPRVTIEPLGTKHAMVLWHEGEAQAMGVTSVIGGKFPDWKAVLVKGDFADLKRQAVPGYQVRYLTGTLNVFKPGVRGIRGHATHYQWHDDGVVLFHIPGHEEVLLGVMPLKAPEDPLVKRWGAALTSLKPRPKKLATEPA